MATKKAASKKTGGKKTAKGGAKKKGASSAKKKAAGSAKKKSNKRISTLKPGNDAGTKGTGSAG